MTVLTGDSSSLRFTVGGGGGVRWSRAGRQSVGVPASRVGSLGSYWVTSPTPPSQRHSGQYQMVSEISPPPVQRN